MHILSFVDRSTVKSQQTKITARMYRSGVENLKICQEAVVYGGDRQIEKNEMRISPDEPRATEKIPASHRASTTLQDLPIEILDYILMKAVVSKVVDKKLAKSEWINCASRLIKPLRTVWSQWNCSLTTKWFKIVLLRNFDRKETPPILVKIITRTRIPGSLAVGKLGKHYFFMCCRNKAANSMHIKVYDEEKLSVIKKTIQLPCKPYCFSSYNGIKITACKKSNSLYVYQSWMNHLLKTPRLWNLYQNNDGKFKIASSEKLTDFYELFARDDGNFDLLRSNNNDDAFLAEDRQSDTFTLCTCRPDGSTIDNIQLPSYFHGSANFARRSNGNCILASYKAGHMIEIKEITKDGKEIRQIRLRRFSASNDTDFMPSAIFIDSCDRIVLFDYMAKTLLFLDAELNWLERVSIDTPKSTTRAVHFDKETNELVVVYKSKEVVIIRWT